MTTKVTIHVNGQYRATVLQKTADGVALPPVIVDGNYTNSPNPTGEHSFYVSHPACTSFEITEEYVELPVGAGG